MALGVFLVDVIDMTLEEPDVVGTVHLVASNPVVAAERAMAYLHQQGLVKTKEEDPNAKYHCNTVVIGQVPETGKKVITVTGGEAAKVLAKPELAGLASAKK